jgi:hypothetical protein
VPDGTACGGGMCQAGACQTSTDVRDRVGIYAWGVDYTSYAGGADRLNWAAQKVADLGSHTIRVALGLRDDYGGVNPAGAITLSDVAAAPAYRALFSNPAFRSFILTTYSNADLQSVWSDGYSAAEAAAERAEIADLGTYLLSTYPGRDFTICNWEGDNAIGPVASQPQAWSGYADWIRARAAGVADARMRVPSATGTLSSCLEFNAVDSLVTGAPCDTNANRCILSVVAPQVNVDVYSYSSWPTMGTRPASQLYAAMTSALDRILTYLPPGTPRSHLMIGEDGAGRELFSECTGVGRVKEAIRATMDWGVKRTIFWQIIDNNPAGYWEAEFGLYKYDGGLSLTGQLFQTLYATQALVEPNPPSCPSIAPGGVVDESGGGFRAGHVVTLWGSFSASGNAVHVRQTNGRQYRIGAGSPWWYESSLYRNQINFMLPSDLVPGDSNLIVYVRDANGIDSNGPLLSVSP